MTLLVHDESTASRPSPMKFVTSLQPHDILMGRGAPSVQHMGNLVLREELVAPRKTEYKNAKRQQTKCDIARQIMNEVAKRGGKFLCKVKTPSEARALGVPDGTVAYTFATDDAAIEKVKQALRDKDPLPTQITLRQEVVRHHEESAPVNRRAQVVSNDAQQVASAQSSSASQTMALIREMQVQQNVQQAVRQLEQQQYLKLLLLQQQIGQQHQHVVRPPYMPIQVVIAGQNTILNCPQMILRLIGNQPAVSFSGPPNERKTCTHLANASQLLVGGGVLPTIHPAGLSVSRQDPSSVDDQQQKKRMSGTPLTPNSYKKTRR